jgi:hypothetical protein
VSEARLNGSTKVLARTSERGYYRNLADQNSNEIRALV